MVQIFLIGIAAGAATALLFASVASGSMFSILLFYLAPLPILIAAIGWSHLAGLIASVSAAAALAAVFGGAFFLAFLIGIGLPAWWLGYLTLLARPAPGNGAETIEWYPPGRLVVWTAVLGAAVVTAGILNFGLDADTFRAGLKRAFERIIRIHLGQPRDGPLQIPGVADANRLMDFLVLAIPPTAAVLATITNLINLWLAARIVKVSGRLKRPWPDLSAIAFPPLSAAVLAAAIAGSFLPGLIGIVAGVLAATLLMAFAVLGFAIVHKITDGMSGRGFLLGGIYAAVAVFGWPVLVMMLIGLADAVLDIRARVAGRRGPPPPNT
jgi:Predicted membrane protein (DUF2232)